jgi:RNA polymerase sigma-70 factor (ECF subfamily)
MTATDEELVARSIGGDADSFNQLILRWERPIYALAYRTIGREEDARRLSGNVSQAFRAPGFRGRAKFSSWLPDALNFAATGSAGSSGPVYPAAGGRRS